MTDKDNFALWETQKYSNYRILGITDEVHEIPLKEVKLGSGNDFFWMEELRR